MDLLKEILTIGYVILVKGGKPSLSKITAEQTSKDVYNVFFESDEGLHKMYYVETKHYDIDNHCFAKFTDKFYLLKIDETLLSDISDLKLRNEVKILLAKELYPKHEERLKKAKEEYKISIENAQNKLTQEKNYLEMVGKCIFS